MAGFPIINDRRRRQPHACTVHEKSILLPWCGAILLFPFYPALSTWFTTVATLRYAVGWLILSPCHGLPTAFSTYHPWQHDAVTDARWLTSPHVGAFLRILCGPCVRHMASVVKLPPRVAARKHALFPVLAPSFNGCAPQLSIVPYTAINVLWMALPPPPSLPDLYPLLTSAYSCGLFLLALAWTFVAIWWQPAVHDAKIKED